MARNVRGLLDARYSLLGKPAEPTYEPGTVALGMSSDVPVAMPVRPRLEHTHVIGTTGGGKSNLLELMIRQDIKNGHGVCVIDPHGNHPDGLHRSLLTWVFAKGFHKSRHVHLIDPNCGEYTTGFNPLALPDPETSVSVVAGAALEAFERVWGDENTHGKPTIRRILKATFAALAELGLTLAEADLLFDHHDRLGIRAFLLRKLSDRYAHAVFSDLDALAKADRTGMRFRDEVVGPLNRLAEFTSSAAIRRIIGQRHHTLDIRATLDRGDIILVNLAGGNQANEADTELLGRLLTRFLFFHVKRRKTQRPFWFYLDECQRYLSGDIPSLLAEARKFNTGVILSHQWQSQLGSEDDQTLAAVHNATNLKISFRVKHPKEAMEIAEGIIPLDLERPVAALIKPTVIGHKRTWFESWSETESESWSTSVSESHSESDTDTEGESWSDSNSAGSGWSNATTLSGGQSWSYERGAITAAQRSVDVGRAATSGTSGSQGTTRSGGGTSARSKSTSTSETITESYSSGHSETHGASEGLEPIYKDLPCAVHNYQNALYFAAQMLRSLRAGEAFASFVDHRGMHNARLLVPRVRQIPVKENVFRDIRALLFKCSPSAVDTPAAVAQIKRDEEKLLLDAKPIAELVPEPTDPQDFRVPIKRAKASLQKDELQPTG